MPSLGADMDAGTVVRWLVEPGDVVRRGDVVAVIETEKSDIEAEIFESGVVDEILVPVGQRVPVGTLLARVSPLAPDAGLGPSAALTAGTGESSRAGPTAGTDQSAGASLPARAGPAAGAPGPALVGGILTAMEQAAGSPARPPSSDDVTAPKPGSEAIASLGDAASLGDTASLGGAAPLGGAASLAGTAGRRRVPSSPLARRRAANLGIELASVAGTGPGGAVVAADVERASGARRLASPPSAPPASAPSGGAGPTPTPTPTPTPGLPGTGRGTALEALRVPTAETGSGRGAPTARRAAMRRAIGALMARSKREVPHYYLATDIALGRASRWLDEANANRPVERRLVMAVLLLKSVALACHAVPEMNGFFADDAFRGSPAVHVGVAVSLRGGGVIAPAIHDADAKSLDELMAALHDLVHRARSGLLRSSEMSDPTLTVTNLGSQGADAVHGVIYAPQVALVGFGRVLDRPWARDGRLVVEPVVTATLAADHRASDGHRGSRFLTTVDRLLQEPGSL